MKHWGIISPVNITKMKSYNNKTCLVINYKAKKYVLKEKDNIKRIKTEYYLLAELIKYNIPISMLIKTTNNDIFVRYRKKLYCLYNYIPGKVYKNHYYAEKKAYNYGKSIALLHKGLKKVNDHKNFSIMDLLKDINMSFKSSYIELPKQLIHRDIHPSNMIFYRNKLKGFIDFEIPTYGIKIFDPCYCSTSILTSKFKSKKARKKWINLLLSILKNYNSINRLKRSEINAIFYVLLSIQLLFMAYMVKIDKIKQLNLIKSS